MIAFFNAWNWEPGVNRTCFWRSKSKIKRKMFVRASTNGTLVHDECPYFPRNYGSKLCTDVPRSITGRVEWYNRDLLRAPEALCVEAFAPPLSTVFSWVKKVVQKTDTMHELSQGQNSTGILLHKFHRHSSSRRMGTVQRFEVTAPLRPRFIVFQ